MPSVPTSVLLSGLSSTALVQVQASVDGAIAVAGNVYQSVSLFHKTSILDVRHEFATLSATLDQTTAHLDDFPADKSDGHQVLGIAPKGVSICAAIARTTGALKSLSGQASQEDGLALLTSYKEVEVKASALFGGINARLASFEVGVPGLALHGLVRLNDLFHALTEALVSVLPPSINASEVHEIHGNIKVSVDSSFSQLGSLKSN